MKVAYDSESGLLVGGMGTPYAGLTLYTFDNDLGTGGSACEDGCLEAWPAVLVPVGDSGADGVPGLGTLTRDDLTVQVTFQGRPLYFFSGDSEPGDTNGDGLADGAWNVVSVPPTALVVQGAIVEDADAFFTNGIVHVIDTVITETLE